jgi:hypothetical protein
METNTEITELTDAQEKTQIAEIAKASILNIKKNKKAYEDLRDEYTGITLPEFTDPEFKKTLKRLTEGSGKLVKARTAADKLVKSEIAILDEVKTLIKSEGEDLKAITADTEKEVKSLKETAEQLVEDAKQEELRQAEEKKQARIAKLYEMGFTHNGAYYQLGELTLTPIQVIQYSEAQFEGFISQAKVVYEAEQLRIAEEEAAEAKRLVDEKKAREEAEEAQRKAQELLAKENEAKQKELDAARAKQKEQDDLIALLQAQIKAQDALKPLEPAIIPSADIKSVEAPKNGTAIKFTEEEKESILHDVLVAEEAMKLDIDDIHEVEIVLKFRASAPFIDTPIGKSTLRIYPEQFLAESQDGLEITDVPASGSIGDELLFLVIKGR